MRQFTLTSLAVYSVLLTFGVARADDVPVDDRRAWRFTNEDVVSTITLQEDGSWIGIRNDGRRPVYDQIEVTDDYIMLQNRETQLFLRLHADWGYWKRPTDADWTRWTVGAWADDSLPAPIGEYRIRVAYFVPSDRTPVDDYEDRVRMILTVVSDLYVASLTDRGYEVDGLRFEEVEGKPVVHLIRGTQAAAHYHNPPQHSEDIQWNRVSEEIRENLGSTDRQLILVLSDTYGNGQSRDLWPGTIARGEYSTADGGLAICSSYLLRDNFAATTLTEMKERFFDETPVRGRRVPGRNANSRRGAFVEYGIGSIAHALGHALGLPDDHRQDELDIMGEGYRNLRWNIDPNEARKVGFSEENARLLMSSRFIASDLDLEDNEPPVVEVERLSSNATSQLFRIQASDNIGVRSLVLYDIEVGSIIGGQRLSGTEQEVRERLPINGTGGFPINLQVIVTDNGGHQTRVRVMETSPE